MNQNLLNALRGGNGGLAKLKPVTAPAARPIIMKANRDHENTDAETSNEEQAREYFFQSGLDAWITPGNPPTSASALAIGLSHDEITLETHIISLSSAEARALLGASPLHKRNDKGKKNTFNSTTTAESSDYLLEQLKAKLSACMQKHNYNKTGCFVKLTTRSPKDSTAAFQRAKGVFVRRRQAGELGVSPTINASTTDEDQSNLWAAFGEELRQALKVKSANAAMELLLSSERVYEDLVYVLEGVERNNKDGETDDNSKSRGKWQLGLVLRKWDDHCKPHTEFRAFVWKGKLTCVGQYFSSLRFECLQGDDVPRRVEEHARAVFDQIREYAPLPSYIMDLVLVDSSCRYLVEINPFDGVGLGTQKASTGLFDWDRDREVLTGRAPFEVRIRRKPLLWDELQRRRAMVNKQWWDAIYG